MASARDSLLAIVCVGAWALAVSACGAPAPAADDEPIPPPPYESFDARPCPPDSALTWENFGDSFMRNWCTACHASALSGASRGGAPLGVDFDELDGVRAEAERIWARGADDNNTMPPAGVPPEAERALLGEWLACGAKSRTD